LANKSAARLIAFKLALTAKMFELPRLQEFLTLFLGKYQYSNSIPSVNDKANTLIQKLLIDQDDIPLFSKISELNSAVRVELKRMNIDEAFFEDAKTYLIDPDQEIHITTQQSPMKLNEIDFDLFDFKNASDQPIRELRIDTLDSVRGCDNLLIGNTSISYTE
jgi:hypothetical protein